MTEASRPKATRLKVRPAGRGRARGRTRLQQQQKEATRKRLIDAARYAFSRGTYAAITVDDVISRAKVSRTSFYRHFESKWDVARALFGQLSPAVRLSWRRLPADPDPSEAELAQWIAGILETLKGHAFLMRILREAETFEPEARAQVSATRTELAGFLGETIPAFAFAAGDAADVETRTRLYLLILQFEELCNAVVVTRSLDPEVGARVMAGQFRQFIDKVAPLAVPAPQKARA
jgi:AcrR family transcriptional regulator